MWVNSVLIPLVLLCFHVVPSAGQGMYTNKLTQWRRFGLLHHQHHHNDVIGACAVSRVTSTTRNFILPSRTVKLKSPRPCLFVTHPKNLSSVYAHCKTVKFITQLRHATQWRTTQQKTSEVSRYRLISQPELDKSQLQCYSKCLKWRPHRSWWLLTVITESHELIILRAFEEP